ncbi:MAG: fluoride efflux transporter FluC [Propioniciclava sp.]
MILIVATAGAGGLGAVMRVLVDERVTRITGDRMPMGSALVNISGSFLLGLLTEWWASHGGDPAIRQAVGAGFLGGYTTFSTACVDAVRLAQAARRRTALVHVLVTLILSVLAAAGGVWLGEG